MPRQIVTKRDLRLAAAARALPGAETVDEELLLAEVDIPGDETKVVSVAPDAYRERLLKYIPSEVIAVYLTLYGLLKSANDPPGWIIWAVFAFGLLVTPLYLARVLHVRKRLQLTIATGAFAVWVFATGGPFLPLPWYQAVYGSLLLVAYTFVVPLIEP